MFEIAVKINDNEAKASLNVLSGENGTLYSSSEETLYSASFEDMRWIDTIGTYLKLLTTLGYVIPIDDVIEGIEEKLEEIKEEGIYPEINKDGDNSEED